MPLAPQRPLWQAHLWVWCSYALALVAAMFIYQAVPGWHPLWRLAAADAVATVVIFAFSVVFNNSSFYDPYWSLAPLVLAWGMVLLAPLAGLGLRQVGVLVLVTAYGLRLTYNWARGWTGLHHEDWRYVDLRQKHGKAYWLVSFSGIHFMPTVLTFLGSVPLWWLLTQPGVALGVGDGLAAAITLAAIVIEAVADQQLLRFRQSQPPAGTIMDRGLWRYSRHPNYFGEMLFWWGIALWALLTTPAPLWTLSGALAITLLFVCISLPMIDERHKARRPGYAEHCQKVSAVIPWPPKRK